MTDNRDDFYLLANARRIAAAKYRRLVNWALAMELFGTGSTSATQICLDAGIDPDGLTVERKQGHLGNAPKVEGGLSVYFQDTTLLKQVAQTGVLSFGGAVVMSKDYYDQLFMNKPPIDPVTFTWEIEDEGKTYKYTGIAPQFVGHTVVFTFPERNK